MRLRCRAGVLACGTMLALLPMAHADETTSAPAFELAGGVIDLEGTAWAWTGSVLVAFGPVGDDGRAIRVYNPFSGDIRTSTAVIPADGSQGLGRAVSIGEKVYLLGLPRTECVEDICFDRGTDDVYVFDPLTDALESFHVENAGAFMGLQPVATGTVAYAVFLTESSTDGIWRLDPESMKVDFIEVESTAYFRIQNAAVWTGQEIVLFGSLGSASEAGIWANFLAFDPSTRTSRVIGAQEFATGPVLRGAAWDGERILMVGARTSGSVAPDNQLVWLDPETEELQLLGVMPGGSMPRGLIFDGTRFLAVGSEGRCILESGQSLWITPIGAPHAAPEARKAPAAEIGITHGSYSQELGQFWVEVDACSSTDDGMLLRAEITRDSGTYWQELGEFRKGTWLHPGKHRFTATVWDDQGMESSTTRTLTLDETPPDIHVTWAVDGLTLHGDASGSTDTSGPIERFSWTWGDGTHDRDRAPNGAPLPAQPAVSHTYPESGAYNVTVVAIAPDGQRSFLAETFVVGAATPTEPRDIPALGIWGIVLIIAYASRMRWAGRSPCPRLRPRF